MTFKNLIAVTAALGLATAPVAASAGTRAASSLPTMESASVLGARSGEAVSKDEQIAGIAPIYIAAFLIGFAALVIFAVSDDDDIDRTDG